MKIGYFLIDWELISDVAKERRPEATAELFAVFSKCVVVRAEERFDLRAVRYLAYCSEFENTPDYVEAPTYDVSITRREGLVGAHKEYVYEATFTKRSCTS